MAETGEYTGDMPPVDFLGPNGPLRAAEVEDPDGEVRMEVTTPPKDAEVWREWEQYRQELSLRLGAEVMARV